MRRINNEQQQQLPQVQHFDFEPIILRDHLSTAGVLLLLLYTLKTPHASLKGSHPKDGFP